MVGWLVGFYGISTFVIYLMQNSFYTNNWFYFKHFSLNIKTVPFLVIQLSISTHLSSIWPVSGTTTPGQSGTRNDGNEGVLRIPQSSSITGTSPSDCLVSYPGHSLEWVLTPWQRSSRYILQPQPTGQPWWFVDCIS